MQCAGGLSDLIRQFGIDWKLLLAQAVNFFLLFFLLQRFAYRPVLAVLRERKRKIEQGLEFTKEAEEKLGQIERIRGETIEEARAEALRIVAGAETTAKARKEEILQETAQKSEHIVAEARRIIQEEKRKMAENVYRHGEEFIRGAVARVLRRMEPEERDRALIEEALKELKSQNA